MHPGKNQASNCALQKTIKQPGANHHQRHINGTEKQNHDGQGGNDQVDQTKFQATGKQIANKNVFKSIPKPSQGKSQDDGMQEVKGIAERIVDKNRVEIFKSDRKQQNRHQF